MPARCQTVVVAVAALVFWVSVLNAAALHAAPAHSADPGPQPGDPRLGLANARRWVDQGDYAKALAELQPYAKDPARYPVHHADYIVVLFWSGDPERAIRLYEAIPASTPQKAYLKRNIAKAYYDTGNPSRAGTLYQSVLDSHPGDMAALEGLIQSRAAAGQAQEALDRLDRLVAAGPARLGPQLLRAGLLIDLERYRDALDSYDRLMTSFGPEAARIARQRDDRLAALAPERRSRAIDQVKSAAAAGERDAAGQLVLLHALFKAYSRSVAVYREYGLDPSRLPTQTAYWAGWAFFKTGMPEAALAIFNRILEQDPDNLRARIGAAYCLADSGQPATARSRLDALAQEMPDDLELLYALAYTLEKEGAFMEAIGVYDRMLVLAPGNLTVERLRIRAFADMGAATYAHAQAGRVLPDDRQFAAALQADAAVHRIRWEEPAAAADILDTLPRAGETDRLQFDRIVALNRDDRHRDAAARYASLPHPDDALPAYVLDAAAGSYLYLDQPETALHLYDRGLEQDPSSFGTRMGKINCLMELRRWNDARRLLDEMDRATPEFTGDGPTRRYHPEKLELAVAWGWLLVHANRLAEADAYFQDLHRKAPANLDIRNALAHIYLWRGWPRRSMEAFDIIHSMDPGYLPAQTGRLAALNAMAFKDQAREAARVLVTQHPRKKWVQRLVRQFDVEAMHANRFDFAFSREEDGLTDIFLQDTVSTPLAQYTRLYGFMLWRRTWDDDPDATDRALGDDRATYFRRIGTGATHIFSSDWEATQQFSINYDDGEAFGSLSRIGWTPDDHWRVAGLLDTFSTDVAKRARAAGVSAKKLWAGIGYRQSEWWEASIALSRQLYSDDNDRDDILLEYQRNLLVRNDWRMRLLVDLYGMRNSRWDAPDVDYFNPKNAWSLALTHMTEQTVRKLGDRAFVHRLFLTVGNYDQYAYASGPVGSIRYEQEHRFSETNGLLWGLSLGSNRYDGESVGSIRVDAAWSVRF